MIYLQATLRVPLKNAEEYYRAVAEEYVPAREKQGMRLVGAWVTKFGAEIPKEITHLWVFEDMAQMYNVIHNKTEELKKAIRTLDGIVMEENIKVLEPLPYSPLQ